MSTTRTTTPARPQRPATAHAFMLLAMAATALACASKDRPAAAASADSAPATSTAAPAGAPAASSAFTPLRGTLASVSDSAIAVTTPQGEVRVALAPPVQVYARVPADLSQVTERAFVGVTSVEQPDGSQRATEIHVFPEALRGTSEGSFLMAQQSSSGGGGRSTMTNGSVAPPPRMTNGTISAQRGGTLTVRYRDSTRAIAVPAGVTVTAIAPTQAALTPGASVVVLARTLPDGTRRASSVLLADPAPRAKP